MGIGVTFGNSVRTWEGQSSIGIDLKETVYALDASTIDLSQSVFSWAPFRSAKAAIKLRNATDLEPD